MTDRARRNTLAGGLILIAIGVLFLMENWYPEFSVWELFLRYWPMIWILLGVKSLYHYFSSTSKARSLVGGVVLIIIGAVLMANKMGYPINFWLIASRYWPVLLILVGVAKLIDYYRFKEKVSIGFSDVVLAIFIIFFGFIAARLAGLDMDTFPWEFPRVMIGKRVPMRMQNSYAYYEEASRPCRPGAHIDVENLNGNIQVWPNTVDEIKVKLKKAIYEDSEPRARGISREIKLLVYEEGGHYTIGTNRGELRRKRYDFTTDMDILVPKSANVNVTNKHGSVRLEGLSGNQQVGSSYGKVEVIDVEGSVRVSNKEGSLTVSGITGNTEIVCKNTKVSVEKIGGSLALENSYSESDVSDVAGSVRIKDKDSSIRVEKAKAAVEITAPGSKVDVVASQGEVKVNSPYSGTITLENIGSSVSIVSSNGPIRVTNVKGDLTIEANYSDIRATQVARAVTVHGDSSLVQADQIKGPINISTSRKDVTINDFGDRVAIHNQHGSISIAAETTLRKNLDIKNEYGSIELSLPENSGFNVEALSKSGGVGSEFQGPHLQISNDTDGKINGSYGGGGSLIKLETSYAEIRLRKGSKTTAKGS